MKQLTAHDTPDIPNTQIVKRTSLYDLPEKLQAKLTTAEQRYVMNEQGQRVREMSDSDLVAAIKALLKSTWFTSGQKAPEKYDFDLTCLDFKNKLHQYYSNTAFLEVQAALNAGVSKQLGSTSFAMNVSTFMDWINLYLFSKERTSAIASYQLLTQKTVTEQMKKDELQKIVDDFIKSEYDVFLKTGTVLNIGNATFHTLWMQKKIRFSDEKRDELLKLATTKVEAEMATELANARLKGERISLQGAFGQTKESRIKREAGIIAVIAYFLTLKAENDKLTKTLNFT